ncbi:GntR family transcriptional regulator [Lacrimispora amygdalina]|uniref:GntR family transcriptional regulator n=1 Tax=Lacrimispora amygdalina TaxID=253257 RepID=UPI000BE2A606|nr:GntR family transcriptional regulator [Lacrimispora amygdalina]
MEIDKKSQQPLYAQLMKEIKDLIQKGEYEAGDQIPTEIELSEKYQVSRITVRRTIEELCTQGILVKRQGKGTFVEAPKIYRKVEKDNNMSFSESCRANGRKPASHVIACHFVEAEERQNEFLKLTDDKRLYHIERVLSADDLPIIYEQIYIPAIRVPDLQVEKLENGSLFQLLAEDYQITEFAKGRSTIEVRTASKPIADYLKMNVGEPVMILKSYMNDEEEKPLYISYEIIVGSRYRISI